LYVPLPEYASCVWNPHLIVHIEKIESVQKAFTKRLLGWKSLSYSDRLTHLHASSLELRRLHSDLVMYYRIMHSYVDVDVSHYFMMSHNTQTRGHNFKLVKERCSNNKVENQFKFRVIDIWNSLPYNTVNATSVYSFKSLLYHSNLIDFLHI
jgi:hypothetical protein